MHLALRPRALGPLVIVPARSRSVPCSAIKRRRSPRGSPGDSFAFEVHAPGDSVAHDAANPRDEDSMMREYKELYRESGLRQELRARSRFERPRDKAKRERRELIQQRKWERDNRSTWEPATLQDGCDQMLDAPFAGYYARGGGAQQEEVDEEEGLFGAQPIAGGEWLVQWSGNDVWGAGADASWQGGYLDDGAATGLQPWFEPAPAAAPGTGQQQPAAAPTAPQTTPAAAQPPLHTTVASGWLRAPPFEEAAAEVPATPAPSRALSIADQLTAEAEAAAEGAAVQRIEEGAAQLPEGAGAVLPVAAGGPVDIITTAEEGTPGFAADVRAAVAALQSRLQATGDEMNGVLPRAEAENAGSPGGEAAQDGQRRTGLPRASWRGERSGPRGATRGQGRGRGAVRESNPTRR